MRVMRWRPSVVNGDDRQGPFVGDDDCMTVTLPVWRGLVRKRGKNKEEGGEVRGEKASEYRKKKAERKCIKESIRTELYDSRGDVSL
ncbi:hypothetical protein Tco_0991998 [Tanacetum coccineum]|uniref:Uncharacterized protein n=1 Tax=Tanacetum coccineum TaxID=301880 RepID=A0ABQ5F1Y3_9ASTR